MQQYVDKDVFLHSEIKLVYDLYTVDYELLTYITFTFAPIFWQPLVVLKGAFCRLYFSYI